MTLQDVSYADDCLKSVDILGVVLCKDMMRYASESEPEGHDLHGEAKRMNI